MNFYLFQTFWYPMPNTCRCFKCLMWLFLAVSTGVVCVTSCRRTRRCCPRCYCLLLCFYCYGHVFFPHPRLLFFLFAVSFGGIVAPATPPHRPSKYICELPLSLGLSVLRLWSQLRPRHKDRTLKIPDPAHGLMCRLQMTFELHSGYCHSFEHKLCT